MAVLGAEICAWFVIMALAGWFGARRSSSRSFLLGGLIAIEYLIGVLFALISVQALLGIPVWVIVLSPAVILIPFVIVLFNRVGHLQDSADPTPNDRWKANIFYFNPDDAALFVEKREGWGYTLNFANYWSWILLLGLVLVFASAPFVIA